MVGTANAASDDRLTCEKCHGFYAVEALEGAKPRLRCNSCGNIRELGTAPVPKPEEKGKWTVIGPDGKVMTFGSWEKLVGSARPPAPEEKKLSASALLNTTPPLGAPKLMLDDLESNPILPVRPSAKPSAAKTTSPWGVTPSAPPAGTKPNEKTSTEKKPTLELPKADPIADASTPESSEEAAPLSLRDAIVDEPETSPLSLRDLIPPDDETSPLSLRDVTTSDTDISDADSSDAHEVVSLDDVVLLTPGDAPVESDPHPPARGALRTLPPTRAKGDVAPPPTITFDEPAAVDSQAITTKVDPKRIASKAPPSKAPPSKAPPSKTPPKKEPEAEAKQRSEAPPKSSALSDTRRSPVARAVTAGTSTAPAEPAKRGWVVPAVTIAAVALIGWRLMAASPKAPAPEPAPTVAATTTEPAVTATPTETAAPAETATPAPTETVAATPPPPAAEPAPVATQQTTTTSGTSGSSASSNTASGSGTKTAAVAAAAEPASDKADKTDKKAAPAGGESMSDLLDRAGSARRSGDLAGARELYERVVKQSPSNVEANGGLGDVLRAQGDLGGAKTSYERALAASPTYGPAQLGLADIEWDQGNRGSAQRRYAQIVEQQGRRAPERARQRSAPTE